MDIQQDTQAPKLAAPAVSKFQGKSNVHSRWAKARVAGKVAGRWRLAHPDDVGLNINFDKLPGLPDRTAHLPINPFPSRPNVSVEGSTSARHHFPKFWEEFSRTEDYRTWTTSQYLMQYTGTAFEHATVPCIIAILLSVFALYLKVWHPDISAVLSLDPVVHELIAYPIGFLLVLRTELSFERWAKGTSHVSGVVGASRNIVSKALTYLVVKTEDNADGPAKKTDVINYRKQLLQYTMVFFITTRHNLVKRSKRGVRGAPEEYSNYLSLEEKEYLRLVKQNRPLIVANWMRSVLHFAKIDGCFLTPQSVTDLSDDIDTMVEQWANASTICNSPMPYPYAHLLKVLLCVWLFSIPFSLVGWLTNSFWIIPCITTVFAVTLFGIDGMGNELEDPFGNSYNDIPLEQFEDTLRMDLNYLSGGIDLTYEKSKTASK